MDRWTRVISLRERPVSRWRSIRTGRTTARFILRWSALLCPARRTRPSRRHLPIERFALHQSGEACTSHASPDAGAVGHHFLHMEPSLTAIAAGLLIGLVYCLVNVRVREPGVFALIGLAVMLLGHVTAYLYPFGVGLLLGLAYDAFEEEWYGSAIADSARASYRVRLFLKTFVAGWVSRYRRGGGFGFRKRLKPDQVVHRVVSRSESAPF